MDGTGPVAVFDEGKGEGGGKEVEVGVVASEGDEEHETKERGAGDEAAPRVGDENGEGDDQFRNQRDQSGERGAGKLVDKPGEGVGDGLGKEVVRHGGEVSPGGVAAEKFNEAGAEHEAEDEKPGGYAEECGRDIATWGGRRQARFFQKDDEEAGFEEKCVPLEGEEVLPDVDERKPAEPGEGGRKRSKEAEGKEHGGN